MLREQGLLSAGRDGDEPIGGVSGGDGGSGPADRAEDDEVAALHQRALLAALLEGTAAQETSPVPTAARSVSEEDAAEVPPPLSRPGPPRPRQPVPAPQAPPRPRELDLQAIFQQATAARGTPRRQAARPRHMAILALGAALICYAAWLALAGGPSQAGSDQSAALRPKPTATPPASRDALMDTRSMLLEEARKALAKGDLGGAVQLAREIRRLAPGPWPALDDLEAEITAAQHERERRRQQEDERIRRILAEAKRRYSRADFDNAEFLLSVVLSRRPGHRDAAALLERVRTTRRERDRARRNNRTSPHRRLLPDQAPPSSSPSTYVDDQGHGEAWWRQRKARLVADVERWERRVEQLTGRARQGGHQGTNTALEAAEEHLAAARRALEDLSEEARKAGALPGWLR